MSRPIIDNFTTDEEAKALGELSKDRTVLELGTYKGFGAVHMVQQGAKAVYAVDWHKGDADLGQIDTLTAFWTNVRRHKAEDRVFPLVGTFGAILPVLRPQSFDLCFIDGYHSYEAVAQDIRLSLPLMVPGGIMAFHDYGTNEPAWGVKKAVDELQAKHGQGDLRTYGSLAVVHLSNDSEEP